MGYAFQAAQAHGRCAWSVVEVNAASSKVPLSPVSQTQMPEDVFNLVILRIFCLKVLHLRYCLDLTFFLPFLKS